MRTDIVIIGGGPAGLAAAVAARKSGVRNILIVERDHELGGILNQCIHNGFGLHTFKEELTGPEYAQRYIDLVKSMDIPYLLNTMVVDISPDKTVTVMNKKQGMFAVEAKAVILAMGCRERARGALNIPGHRPAGIYTAGAAQRYVNMEGRMPGREVVILGSGDIGLIMARRMTLEGAVVKAVAELMPFSGGLRRNIVQCLNDFDIPLKLSHTVIEIKGKKRVEGVTLTQVDDQLKPIEGTEEEYSCDTLLLSCGLIPENELSSQIGVQLNPVTAGPVVTESLETNVEGVFACGNVLHVHDLVDDVSLEAQKAGENAAKYLDSLSNWGSMNNSGSLDNWESVNNSDRTDSRGNAETDVKAERPAGGHAAQICGRGGIRYTVPSTVNPQRMGEKLIVRFRVDRIYKGCTLALYCNDICVSRKKRPIMVPGEMEQAVLLKEHLKNIDQLESVTIRIEQEEA